MFLTIIDHVLVNIVNLFVCFRNNLKSRFIIGKTFDITRRIPMIIFLCRIPCTRTGFDFETIPTCVIRSIEKTSRERGVTELCCGVTRTTSEYV